MELTLGRPLLGLAMLLASGCYRTRFEGGATTLPQELRVADLVVVQTIHDDRSLESSVDGPFVAMIGRATPPSLDRTGIAARTLDERDLGTGVTSASFLVRYRLAAFRDRSREGGGRTLTASLCSILVLPCFFLGAAPAYTVEIGSTWEMLVYDIRGVRPTLVRDADTGAITQTFDVTGATPVGRGHYEVTLRGGIGGRDYRDDSLRERAIGNAAAEISARLVARSLADIARAIEDAGDGPLASATTLSAH